MNAVNPTPDALRLPEVSCVRAGYGEVSAWSGLTDDSRTAEAGTLFVSRGPWNDRAAQHLGDAVEKGAAAVLLPEDAIDHPLPGHVAVYTAPRVDQALAGRIADRFFDFPATRLRLVGITGTNGKTTVAMITQHLLKASGVKAGLLGTVWVDVGHESGPTPAELTTPGAIELRLRLAEMVEHGCAAAVMEVSSHALAQGRVDGLAFDSAVFTNLTQDHLDYHGSMDAYAQAKATLFAQLKPEAWAVLNADDPASAQMARHAASERVMRTRTGQPGSARSGDDGPALSSDCTVSPVDLTAAGARARFDGPWGSAEATLPMVGLHNLSNALQAAAAAHSLVPLASRDLRQRLEACPPVPGRLEPVRREDGSGPVVLVDYAHTPDALQRACSAVRAVTDTAGGARLIVVYGCGGDRDRTKRPLMTAAALRYADLAFLTSDNPRSEDPDQILADAQQGVEPADRAKLRVEVDRAKAIRAAVHDAGPRDTVLIAGKGHEDYQVVADPPGVFGRLTRKLHFDDREQADHALREWEPAAVAC